jgi:hypothetical protein
MKTSNLKHFELLSYVAALVMYVLVYTHIDYNHITLSVGFGIVAFCSFLFVGLIAKAMQNDSYSKKQQIREIAVLRAEYGFVEAEKFSRENARIQLKRMQETQRAAR